MYIQSLNILNYEEKIYVNYKICAKCERRRIYIANKKKETLNAKRFGDKKTKHHIKKVRDVLLY